MLSTKDKKSLQDAIVDAEQVTTAEIHIAFYKALHHADVMQDAQLYFHRIELHQNKHKNNILIYIVESARRFAILGDEDIHQKVGDVYWQQLSAQLSEHFKKGEVYAGLLHCIQQLKADLQKHYPKGL